MNSIDTVFAWLLAATLRASVLVVVILGIQFVLRRWLPAGWRHALWLPMLAVLLLPALPEAPFGLFPPSAHVTANVEASDILVGTSEYTAPATVAAPVIAPSHVVSNAVDTDGPAGTSDRTAAAMNPARGPGGAAKWNYFAIAWLLGAWTVLAAGIIGYRRNMRRIRLHASVPDRMLQAAIDNAAGDAGLKRAPQAIISPSVVSPAVTGFVRPVLLLPAGFPEGFSVAETRLILLHEFSHLKRLDLPLNWLMCVLQAMHWFNPLLWFAFARMRADREAACDARVLSIDATDRRAEYGGALLKLQCATPARALSLGFVGIFERGSEIQSRIRGISTYRQGRIVWRVAGGAIVTLLMVFGVTKGQQPGPAAAGGKDSAGMLELAKNPHSSVPGNDAAKEAITNKLRNIVIPKIYFEDVSLEEAINFLRMRARELDVKEPDPGKKGLNIVIRRPAAAADAAAQPEIIKELRLRNVPLANTLKYICEQTHFNYTVDDDTVILEPVNPIGANHKTTVLPIDDVAKEAVTNKLRNIVIPRIDFVDVSLEEAIGLLRMRGMELDVKEPDADKKGLNFVIFRQAPAADAAVQPEKIKELRVRNVTLAVALKYICEQTHFNYTVDDFAVILRPKEEAIPKTGVPTDPAESRMQNKLDSNIVPEMDFEDKKESASTTPKEDHEKAAKLAVVFNSLKKSDAEALAANLPGLSREQATAMIQRIAAQWGDLTKLTTAKEFPTQLDKGAMRMIEQWGSQATTTGKWLNLRSDAAPGRWLRVGLLFAKDESQPRQFLAVEWPGDAK